MKIFVSLSFVFLIGITSAFAQDKYWFYISSSAISNFVYYSQILKCPEPVTTPGHYTKSNAVGPFSSDAEARNARRDEIDIAKNSGKELRLQTAVCNTKWKVRLPPAKDKFPPKAR